MAGKTDDIEEVDDSGHYGRHNAGILLRGCGPVYENDRSLQETFWYMDIERFYN